MSTENPEEPDIRQARFGGINKALPMYNVPLGIFPDARNMVTYAREGYMETRPGYQVASPRVEVDPFAMLGGVEGGLVIVVPGDPTDEDLEGDFVMSVEDSNSTIMYYKTGKWYGYDPSATMIQATGSLLFTTYGGDDLGIEADEYTWHHYVLWGTGDHTTTTDVTYTDQAASKTLTFILPPDDSLGSYGTLVSSWDRGDGTILNVYYYGTATITASGVDTNDDTRTVSKTFAILYFPGSVGGGGGGGGGGTEEDETEPEDEEEDDDDTDDGDDGEDGDDGDDTDEPTISIITPPTITPPDSPPIVPPDDPDEPDEPGGGDDEDIKTDKIQLIVTAPETVQHNGYFSFTVTAKNLKTGMMVALPGVPTLRAYLPTDYMPGLKTSSTYYTEARYLIDTAAATGVFSNGNTVWTMTNARFNLPETPDDSYDLVTNVRAVISATILGNKNYLQGGTMTNVVRPIPTLSVNLHTLDLDGLDGREYVGFTGTNAYSSTIMLWVTQTAMAGVGGTFIPFDIVLYAASMVGASATMTWGKACPGPTWVEGSSVSLGSTASGYPSIPSAVFESGDGVALVKLTVAWSGTAADPDNGIWPWYVDDNWTGFEVFAMLPSYLEQNRASLSNDAFSVTKQTSSGVAFASARQILLGMQYAKVGLPDDYVSVDEDFYQEYVCASGQTWAVDAVLYDPDHEVSRRITGGFTVVGGTDTYAMTAGVINDTATPAIAIPSGEWLQSDDLDEDLVTPRLGDRDLYIYGYAPGKCLATTYDLYRECGATDVDKYDTYRECAG